MIIGFCLFAGLSFPAYFGNPELVVEISWADWLGDMIKTVGSTGMAVAAIFGLILDNVIPGTAHERGLDVDVEGAQTEIGEPHPHQ